MRQLVKQWTMQFLSPSGVLTRYESSCLDPPRVQLQDMKPLQAVQSQPPAPGHPTVGAVTWSLCLAVAGTCGYPSFRSLYKEQTG